MVEHQATPDIYIERWTGQIEHGTWTNLSQGGNFGPGWIQFRKTLPNEAIAPLPEEYLNQLHQKERDEASHL